MNTLNRTITGIILIVIGIVLLVIGYFIPYLLIYGIPSLIIGVFIYLNKKEDDIEEIKQK